ncbi:hypothetical protein B0A54_09149 [Friedmanniomyces endolithicus]|uniref:Apple domain-containing protein n=1 Tax=Friedmanniomyces endolithicus TaxID=329885 RepID=A0A4V5N8Y6_9PEZI|nr:hypothetical protein LTS09_001470 [Friedmanniomyces endolithicus]TKA38209.1 hypothetical protein B0A54_09149 [Friedmanniomyces endolithicus]
MQSFTTVVTFLALASRSVFATEILRLNTTANGTTAGSAASISAAPSAALNACGTTFDPCPACDGQTMQDFAGVSYAVTCDSFIASTDQYAAATGVINTTSQCLEACDELSGCLGVYFFPVTDAVCTLITGTIVGVESQQGYNAYVRQGAPNTTAPSSTSYDNTTSIASRVSTFYYQTTEDAPAPPPSSNVSAIAAAPKCPATNVTCPACNGETVTDARNRTYNVFCDNQLYADGDYNIQRWVSPEGCLAECDNYSWCIGSTFRPEGNCQLAKGQNVFPEEMQGYTAFLPVPNKTAVVAAPQSPSAYPTTDRYTAVTASPPPPSTFATVTSGAVPTSSTSIPSCNPDIARCPACDGASVTDWLNQTYTISCNEVPICGLVVNRANHTLQFECLEYCDADPICFAASWESGSCDLCQENLEGRTLEVQAGPADYVYYYPVSPGVVASRTASSTASMTLALSGGSAIPTADITPAIPAITATLTSLPLAPPPTTTSEAITGILTSLQLATQSTSISEGIATQVQANTFITAAAPSGAEIVIEITLTVTELEAAASVTSVALTTPSITFVPSLTDGSVSLATPGGQTRRV